MSNGGIIGPVNIPTTNTASGIWTLEEQQLAKAQNIWPTFKDEYFEYTTLLLPGNGTNGAQNNTFLDGSTNNFTITRNGNTTQGTFSPFSQTGWGNYFDGSSGYLTTPANTAFAFGTGDFTVEMFVNTSNLTTGGFVSHGPAATSGYWMFELSGGSFFWQASGVANILVVSASSYLSNSVWTHLCVSRVSGTTRMFANGTQIASATDNTNYSGSSSGSLSIGRSYNGTYTTGYISNLRIVKGTGVTTVTVPTAPLTAISGTSILTCQSNRFIDNSTNNFTITRNGNASVVAFSPFNPSASWSAATYGGSGYFDGSGDYLTTPSNTSFAFGGNWTIEFWFYPLSQSSAAGLIAFSDNKDNIDYTLSSNSLLYYNGSTATTFTGVSVTVSAWNHVAIVNASGTVRAYVNGSQSTNSGSGVTTSSARSFNILANIVGSAITGGYVSGLRVVNGTAVYTGAFTPPTAPISTSGSASASAYPSTTNVNTSFASSDTKLLLNCTNAGIYDATSKNDLETVGNAQISTTQSKWGGSSMYFDGSGDYLTTVSKQEIIIGTSTFTAEAWFYLTSSTTDQCIFGGSSLNNPFALYVNSSTQIAVDQYGTGVITFAVPTISLNTWYHIAVVRNSTTTRVYLNGTESTTGGVSDSRNYSGATNQIGANQTNNRLLTGYIQDARITKGIARYTANFAGPLLSPFPTL